MRARRVLTTIAVTTLALAAPGALMAPAGAKETPGFRRVGFLPVPPKSELSSETIMRVDATRQRMYVAFTRPLTYLWWIAEYDLAPAIPRYLREGLFGTFAQLSGGPTLSPNTVALDTRRNRLLILSQDGSAACPGDPEPFCGSDTPAPIKIFVFDIKTMRVVDVVNVQLTLPGFTARGMSYSEADDRLYLAGELQPLGGESLGATGLGINPRSLPGQVAAFDISDVGVFSVAWTRLVPECQVVMHAFRTGITIAKSAQHPALYFPCAATPTSPGPSGIFRMWVTPDANQTEALNFPLEMFSVPGSFVSGDGIVGSGRFDYTTDRFFMQSRSVTTPGAWVFDGNLSAWVGFIAAPDGTNQFSGLNEGSGRYYMASYNSDYIVAADSHATPIPQGRVSRLDLPTQSPLWADPGSRRLFAHSGEDIVKGYRWVVYEDLSPPRLGEEEADFDSLTTDIPEGANTISSYSGTVNGFGARATLVGGSDSLISKDLCQTVPGENPCTVARTVLKNAFDFSPAGSARAVYAGWVPALDVRNVVTSSLAQAMSLDHVSSGEYETVVGSLAERAQEQGQEDAAEQIERSLVWPYNDVECLDSGEKPDPEQAAGLGGTASASCSYATQEATAKASFTGIELTGLTIAHSSFESESHRDPKIGIVTSARSMARGVEIVAPAGTVFISKVVAVARTAAHGRPGTAAAEWARTFEGVTVKDAAGATVFECSVGGDCDPTEAVEAMNEALKGRARIELPTPEITKTKGGALAGVRETQSDYIDGLVINDDDNRAVSALQITLYNDTSEKSRVVVELAAIQAASIYGISPLPSDQLPPDDGGGPITLPPVGPIAPPIFGGGPTVIPPPAGGPVAQLARSAVFLIRSPKEALLVGSTLLLLIAAVASGWRRRVLLRQIGGGS